MWCWQIEDLESLYFQQGQKRKKSWLRKREVSWLGDISSSAFYTCSLSNSWLGDITLLCHFLLQAKLQVGDVVKCCIKKITYFGIFVEVISENFAAHVSSNH
jgi:hypothetical protein